MTLTNNPPKIIVLANSIPWCSAIERSFPKSQLSWALDLEAVSSEISAGNSCAAILEIPSQPTPNWLTTVSKLNNNAYGVLLFGVGDEQVRAWQNVLDFAGFSGKAWSLLQLSSLVSQISKHQQNSISVTGTLESSIEASLPWPTS